MGKAPEYSEWRKDKSRMNNEGSDSDAEIGTHQTGTSKYNGKT